MSVEFVPEQAVPPVPPVPPAPGEPAPAPRQPIPTPGRPRRLWLRSLTSTLVTGVVTLVVLLVAAIGAATYFSLSSFLFNRLDQQVAPIADANASRIQECLSNSVSVCGIGGGSGYRAPQVEWVAILDPRGNIAITVRDEAGALQSMQLTAARRQQLARSQPSAETLQTVDGYELRVSVRPIAGTQLVAVSGLSTGDVERTLHRLVNLELIIGAGAVAIAFVATTLGVQRSLRNLYKVTSTAREVTAELSPEGAGLERRVPVFEEGTEVGQLAYSVNTLLSAVETQFAARVESERRMRQFLADASHELRTPLTSIRGFAELARMQRAMGESTEDNLDRIESEGTRMSRLVEDLLILARGDDVDHAPPVREPVDVPTMVDDAVAGARAAFPQRRIDLQVVPVPMVRGDRDQLLRVVRNLVTNACVHTAPERPITVRTYPDEHQVVVQIIDGGPGLPPEEAAHVFERFWRADKARTRARGGSGLGMSIVATLVRAHGGSVVFDSTVESGSTVTVRLPAAYDVVLGTDDDASDDHGNGRGTEA